MKEIYLSHQAALKNIDDETQEHILTLKALSDNGAVKVTAEYDVLNGNNLKKIAVMGWNHMDKFSQVH